MRPSAPYAAQTTRRTRSVSNPTRSCSPHSTVEAPSGRRPDASRDTASRRNQQRRRPHARAKPQCPVAWNSIGAGDAPALSPKHEHRGTRSCSGGRLQLVRRRRLTRSARDARFAWRVAVLDVAPTARARPSREAHRTSTRARDRGAYHVERAVAYTDKTRLVTIATNVSGASRNSRPRSSVWTARGPSPSRALSSVLRSDRTPSGLSRAPSGPHPEGGEDP
jgi:hypothetical protein